MLRMLWTMISIFATLAASAANAQEIDWQKVDDALGRKPGVSGDVHRYGFPRTDLAVTLDGVTIKPALALGGWIAFKPAHGGAMAMGDLVLLESEVNPVMLKLIEGGLEITAVHNHLLRASPPTFYMHVGGHGDPAKMAAVIRDALGAHRANARHFAQTIGLRFDRVEHFLPEGANQLLGIDRADPPDHAGAKILLDAFDRCRR